MSDTVHSVVYL